MDVALALDQRFHGRMVRLPPPPKQGEELAVIVLHRELGFAGGVDHLHNLGAIVIPLQPLRLIPFDQRAVWSAPIGARSEIADDVEREPAQGIVPGFRSITGLVDIDPENPVLGTVLLQLIPGTGCQRQARPVVDGASLQGPGGRNQPRVVDETTSSVGLQHQRTFSGNGIRLRELHPPRAPHYHQERTEETELNPTKARIERHRTRV